MHSSSGKLQWSDLEVILAVCRAGSLSGAARSLGLNHSTVFRKISAIEERTAVRFFDRLPSGYRMTEAGETALVHAERIQSEMDALEREILGQDLRLRGQVRLTAPEGMSALVLPEALCEFQRQHPGVTFEVAGTAAALDLRRREAEVAIRATKKPPETALGRRVCRFRFGIYAAPSYLDQHPDPPIEELDWVMLTDVADWIVPQVFKRRRDADEQTVFTSMSLFAVVNTVAAGAGLAPLPSYVGEEDPRLRRIGGALEHLTMDLWVLTHPDLRHTVRVKALMSFLYDFLESRRTIFEGS